jgi:hypothetical protein
MTPDSLVIALVGIRLVLVSAGCLGSLLRDAVARELRAHAR